MLWVVGIGLILIGIALLIGAIALIKPLNNLSKTLKNVEKTTETLPEDIQDITAQTKSALGDSAQVLNQVNDNIKELNPIFRIIGDLGRTTNQVSSSIASAVSDVKEKTEATNKYARGKNLEGLYGILTLGYLLFKRNRESK